MLRNHRLLEAGAVFRALRDVNDEIQESSACASRCRGP